jgi:hypothetical protein
MILLFLLFLEIHGAILGVRMVTLMLKGTRKTTADSLFLLILHANFN